LVLAKDKVTHCRTHWI